MQKKKESNALARARAKYDAENTLRIGLKLNRKTDADIIEHLRSIPPASGGSGGMQGYIKELIRADVNTKNAHETRNPRK